MAKLAPTSTKYVIKARVKAKGVIEKPDVIGAIFGQTEGLLGSSLDLRELQRTGRIGRIEVRIKSSQGKSEGEIEIPSSLDSSETALIAAVIETIERVGPCNAEIHLEGIEDTRTVKRDYVTNRAKDILKNMMDKNAPDTENVLEGIKESIRAEEITKYHGLPCGPGMLESDEIIIVEGRADVINLLKYGIRNTIAIEGTSIPQTVVDLTKEKIVTLFVDGDRGGQLISKELMQRAEIDFVAMAPIGKEVEELSKKETYKALRSRVSADQFKVNGNKLPAAKAPMPAKREKERPTTRKVKLKSEQKALFRKTLEELVGTRAACIFNEKNDLLGKVPVSELLNTLKTVDEPYTIIFDGKVDSRLNDLAKMKGVRFLVGMEKESISSPVNILSRKDLGK